MYLDMCEEMHLCPSDVSARGALQQPAPAVEAGRSLPAAGEAEEDFRLKISPLTGQRQPQESAQV